MDRGKKVRVKQLRTRCKEDARSLSKKKRQEFMDYIWQGMTIGEAQEKANITFEQALGILDLNINKHRYCTLNRESV